MTTKGEHTISEDNQPPLKQSDLRHFTGSEQWYRHGINRKVLFTDGARHVAEAAGAAKAENAESAEGGRADSTGAKDAWQLEQIEPRVVSNRAVRTVKPPAAALLRYTRLEAGAGAGLHCTRALFDGAS